MKKWLRWLGLVGVVVVSTILLNLALPIARAPINSLLGRIGVKSEFTIGLAGTAYAATADYTVDGTADDVQAQQALNALPSTGGKLVFFGGNYNFTATVSRAINNVTIEGSGKSTYFAFNAATALFSAGAQAGWIFKDFRTDAGWVTVSSAGDTLFAGDLWKGTALISNVVSSGTTMPASPVKGQQFLQSATGRDVLSTYNGTAWQPMQSFGTYTVYVDGASGTDDVNHGTGTGANAYATIQYAWNQLPPARDPTVTTTINIAAGTYAEAPILTGKVSGWYNGIPINLVGATSTNATGTATGGVAGAGAAHPQINGTFTAGAYDGLLVRFDTGANAGLVRVVGQTTTTKLWLDGAALTGAPQNGDNYTILDWGTTISGQFQIVNAYVSMNYLKFTSASGSSFWANTGVTAAYCKWATTNAGGALFIGSASWTTLYLSVFDITVNNGSTSYGIRVQDVSQLEAWGIKMVGHSSGGSTIEGITAQVGGVISDISGSEISGFYAGLQASLGSSGTSPPWNIAGSITNFIHGNTYGIQAISGGHFSVASGNTYGTKLDGTADANSGGDTNADATSYSWIGS